MYPALQKRKSLREIFLPLWKQKKIKFYENVLVCFAFELGGRIRYKITMKNVHFYVEI